MMHGFRQLRLLLWKNLKLKLRNPGLLVAEVLVPLLCAGLIVKLRFSVDVKPRTGPIVHEVRNVTFPESLTKQWQMGVVPDNAATKRVMHFLKKSYLMHHPDKGFPEIKMFDTEDAAMVYQLSHRKMTLIIVFEGLNQSASAPRLPADVKYTIKPRVGRRYYHTNKVLPFPPPNWHTCRRGDRFSLSGLQYLVGLSLARHWTQQAGRDPWSVDFGVNTRCMPVQGYREDPMVLILRHTLPSYLVTSFLISAIIFTKTIVAEKELKLKESMKLMGLKPATYWLSWLLSFAVFFVPVILLYSALFLVGWDPRNGPVISKIDVSLFIVFLLCYGLAIITFCFMISTFVNKANIAAAMAGILFYALYMPFNRLRKVYRQTSRWTKLGAGLSFNIAMSQGVFIMSFAWASLGGEGMKWSNFHRPVVPEDNFSLLDCMLMMLLDSALHCLLAWYLDQVLPGEHGVAKPPWFLFMRDYWYPHEKRNCSSVQESQTNSIYFEPDPEHLEAGVRLRKLRKVFKDKVPVKGTNLNMYKGQITVLLGHNGAGKTVTLGMLTGFIPPSSGTAIINGHDIRKQLEAARRSLGLCPQFNILFDKLTVREHLEFFSELKGLSGQKREADVEKIAEEAGLQFKMDTWAGRLSGGQKRKLSVAIALAGGSKVIILDEPTAGMDPAARRDTWQVLKRARKGRTILLTTHYMDEADLLGDRIAIMAEGTVKCCGSPRFLKRLYGSGYHLSVTMQPDCEVSDLMEAVQEHVEEARLEAMLRDEATINLPEEASHLFPRLFITLDARMQELHITGFGISTTSMEEVFLAVGIGPAEGEMEATFSGSVQRHGVSSSTLSCHASSLMRATSFPGTNVDLSASKRNMMIGSPTPSSYNLPSSSVPSKMHQTTSQLAAFGTPDDGSVRRLTGVRLTASVLRALVTKKLLYTRRHLWLYLTQLTLPFVLLAAMLFAESEKKPVVLVEPRLTFDLAVFPTARVPYTAGMTRTPESLRLASRYANQFRDQDDVLLERVDVQRDATYNDYILKRTTDLGLHESLRTLPIGMEVLPPKQLQSIAAVAHFSSYPLHSLQISLNYLLNAMVQHTLNDSYRIQSAVEPLQKDLGIGEPFNSFKTHLAAAGYAMSVSVSVAFMTIMMFHFLILERKIGVKHLQMMNGASPLAYWGSTFLVDYLTYGMGATLVLSAFFLVPDDAYVSRDDGKWPLLALALACYGWAGLAFLYAMQFAFSTPSSGAVFNVVFNILTGIVPTVIILMMRLMYIFGLATLDPDIWLLDTFCCVAFPTYSLCSCFKNIFINYYSLRRCHGNKCGGFWAPCCKETCEVYLCIDHSQNYLAMGEPAIGHYIASMVAQGFVFFTFVLLMDYHVLDHLGYALRFGRCKGVDAKREDFSGEDSDVAAERKRILQHPHSFYISNDPTSDRLSLVDLYRCYGTFVTVDHLCVGIPQGECFGLMGQNGAGKTSTFKMITGDLLVTAGNAYVLGRDVVSNVTKVQSAVGYCPQFDGFLLELTGRETLTLYARLRGLPEAVIRDRVDSIMQFLMLEEQSDVLGKVYSGGNRRKLITAVSLVGDSPVLVFDEPSWGMDIRARRNLWEVLALRRDQGTTLVFSSHSMAECEFLCTRAAIMVNGQLVCLGSPQHLKSKFGAGYTFIVQLAPLEDGSPASTEPIIEHILRNVADSELFDHHQNYLHFKSPSAPGRLAAIFTLLEEAKLNHYIQDYSVQQTTLEQVFLSFTRFQAAPKEDKSRSWRGMMSLNK